MQQNDTIVITGAAGFIASYLTGLLNRQGFEQLILVDDFSHAEKARNLEGKKFIRQIDRTEFIAWADANRGSFQYCFHLGARTDTTEMDYTIHQRLNLEYSKEVWRICTAQNIPLLYASSAATYGNGEWGYDDTNMEALQHLQPLNPYGLSKHQFDLWALKQTATPPFWAGVKFFNVYGPNEYHKARMASVILHAYRQIKESGRVKLFRSHNPNYTDGGQMRDFVYVADVANMCQWLLQQQPASGIYNIGSGTARTFHALVSAIFTTLNVPAHIDFIDTPADIRDKYQYFTEANMQKLRTAGYTAPLHTLEEGVGAYITDYLSKGSYF